MADNSKKLVSKEVALSAAIGAGLGITHGLKNNKLLSSALLGAGVGTLVGIFGQSLFTDNNTQSRTETLSGNQQD